MNKRIIAAAIIAATTMPIKAAIITQEVSFGEQGSPFDVAEVSPLSESVFIDTFVFEQANFVNPLVSAQSSPEGTFTMIPGEDSAEFEFDVTTGERSGMLANVDLSAFLAGTPIEFLFSTDARTNVFNQVDGGTGSFTNEFSTGSWGKVFVEFDYAPTATSVSEPAAFSLFGAGLLFLLSNRRKVIKK